MDGIIQTMEQLEIEGRRILIRVDFNVPLVDGEIADSERIEATIPTIKQAINRNAHVILLSHLGRPDGTDPALSLRPVARRLSDILRKPVRMAKGVIDDRVMDQVKRLGPGEVIMLENVRFHEGETQNDEELSAALSSMAEVYINDAFGVSHRAHSSVYGVPLHFREAGAGLLVQKELHYLHEKINEPAQPFVCIFGGAKVEEKLLAVRNMMKSAQHILIGGGMAYTFLKAQGHSVGKSIVAKDRVKEAKAILADAEKMGVEIHLPVDHVQARRFSENARAEVTDGVDIDKDMMGLDIGPKTVELFSGIIAGAKTTLWNGPMGVFEWERFAEGSMSIARVVGANKGTTIVGGGDSISLISKSGMTKMISHISTGGGAMLSFLSGEPMPGLDVLRREL